MPIFTEHLRNEAGVIQFGLNQLEKSRQEIFEGREPDVQDLRLVTYALRLLFKRAHLQKLENVLYPELAPSHVDEKGFERFDEQTERLYNGQARLNLLRLQLALDAHSDRSSRDELAHYLEDFLTVSRHVLETTINVVLPLADRVLTTDQQNELYMKAQEFDRKQALERLQATQALMNMGIDRAAAGA